MKTRFVIWMMFGLLVAHVQPLPGAEAGKKGKTTASWEDLAECKLPNGLTILPGRGTYLARKAGGTVFSFAQKKFFPAPDPEPDEKDFTVKKFISMLKGDIFYATAEEGCFMVTSGRIAGLGKHYLHEFDRKELARPKVMTTKQDGQDVPGFITGIQALTGHCFILETMDRKYVLLRIVSQDRKKQQQARVQWVYQPNGTCKFSIPKGKVLVPEVTPRSDRGQDGNAVAIPTISKLDDRDFAKAAATHNKNRVKLKTLSISLLSSDDVSVQLRRLACDALGDMRTPEGAPVLAAKINVNLALKSRDITVENNYRCVGALIKIGVPGALASMDQMEIDAQSKPPKDANARDAMNWNLRIQSRRRLLALVLLKVYGEKLAKVVLEDKIAQAKDPKAKAAFQQALEAFPEIKNWLRKKKKPPTRPAK